VRIDERIGLPVPSDAVGDLRGEPAVHRAFDPVGHHPADNDSGSRSGKQGVSEKIHEEGAHSHNPRERPRIPDPRRSRKKGR
jgi:hypothetical protein